MTREETLLTQTFILDSFTKFQADDIRIVSVRKRSHKDGVTHIDVLSEYNAYATSSYDCCVYIWSIREDKKLGALLLGNGKTAAEMKKKEQKDLKELKDKKESKDAKDQKDKKDQPVRYDQKDRPDQWLFRVDEEKRRKDEEKEASEALVKMDEGKALKDKVKNESRKFTEAKQTIEHASSVIKKVGSTHAVQETRA